MDACTRHRHGLRRLAERWWRRYASSVRRGVNPPSEGFGMLAEIDRHTVDYCLLRIRNFGPVAPPMPKNQYGVLLDGAHRDNIQTGDQWDDCAATR
ncbi:MAG: hypothetical protein M3P18_11665 [Actinomycetota bacterium]|nr:hypothetical protein [Actinomycetota bacterium]